MLDGMKNYIFGGAMIIAGLLTIPFPELNISVLGMEGTSTLITSGIAWILGRNAIKKLEG